MMMIIIILISMVMIYNLTALLKVKIQSTISPIVVKVCLTGKYFDQRKRRMECSLVIP